MEIVEEMIRAGIQRRQKHRDYLTGRHYALAIQLEALELDRSASGIGDLELHRRIGRHRKRRWFKAATIDFQF